MMPRNWHHGHSLGAGLVVGLVVASYHVWILLAAAFCLGVIAANIARIVGWIRRELVSRARRRHTTGATF